MHRRLPSAGPDIGHADDGYFHALPFKRDRGGEQAVAGRYVVKIIASDRTVEPRHGLFESFGAIGGFPIARGENIDAKRVQGLEDRFTFGPCGRTRALELVASVKHKAGPVAVRSLIFDGGLEAGIAAHHLDFWIRPRQIFRMRFELRMRVGEVQQHQTFAVCNLIRPRRRCDKIGYCNSRADRR